MATRDVLYAFYDLAISPASFDFSTFAVCADVYRRQKGFASFHVVVVPVERGEGHWDGKLYDAKHFSWRVNNVIVPLSALVPSRSGITICHSRDMARAMHARAGTDAVFPESYTVDQPVDQHHTGWSILLGHLGEDVQVMSASGQARAYARQWIDSRAAGRPCVALTLREAPFLPGRNSDPVMWGAVARSLCEAGFFPVILRDIDRAFDEPDPSFGTTAVFTEPVFNLDLRMAFYEECHIAMFVANGPAMPCFFDRNTRYVYLVCGDWLGPPTPFGRVGLEAGETPPFANRYQRWVWHAQDLELVMQDFTSLDRQIATDRATDAIDLRPCPEYRRDISILSKRLDNWAERGYGLAREDIRLADAARALAHGRGESDEDRLKSLIALALNANNLDKAIALIRTHGDRYGYTIAAYVRLGVISEAMNRFREAISYYEQALVDDAENPDVLYRLGVVSHQVGDLTRARDCFEPLVARGIKHPELHRELDAVYQALGVADPAPEGAARL